MARRCVFCDRKATTKEHALPGWIPRRYGLAKDFLKPYSLGGRVNPSKGRHLISVKSVRRLMFCQICQEHFRDLEDRVIPILGPMSDGESLTLDRQSQRLLAEWGAKTAYALFGYIDEEALIPDDHRQLVRNQGRPPQHAFVGYGKYTGPTDLFVSVVPVAAKDVTAPRLAYNAVAAFGKVVLKVGGIIEPANHTAFRIPKDRFVQVWPEWRVPFEWPPPIALTESEMPDVIGWIPVAPERDSPVEVVDYPENV